MLAIIAKFVIPLAVLIALIVYVKRKAKWGEHVVSELPAQLERDAATQPRRTTSIWLIGVIVGIAIFFVVLERNSYIVSGITGAVFITSYIYFNMRAWNRWLQRGDLQSYNGRTFGKMGPGSGMTTIASILALIVFAALKLLKL